ncbi:hypothetical protein C2S53_018905 [Perilla frutescens var. hirtella]|uniref:Disease resistance protein At4g27190-like leucine-rich repeats domain-containing protein n=1 Tax=Perilla frutescens var. hirtella TaxID=608512 RepID=A0AAD4J5D7_PERFH|nr:hypothetical protein C2S53_018905 [Perilla frutescens var. hirtella]
MMEQVFLWNEEYEGIGGIEFPLLRTLSIKECPKIIVIGSNQNNSEGSSNNAHIDHNHSSPLFSQQQKISFGSLKKLIITGNDRSMSLFSSSIAANLVGLTVLSISKCDEMVQVIQDEEKKKGVIGGDQNTLLFHNLEELELKDLRKLVSFCEWNCDIVLPSLIQVVIDECPDMKYFTSGPLSAPDLKFVNINGDHFGGLNDLNDTLQQHYLAQEQAKISPWDSYLYQT